MCLGRLAKDLKQSIRNKLPRNRGVLRKDNDMKVKIGDKIRSKYGKERILTVQSIGNVKFYDVIDENGIHDVIQEDYVKPYVEPARSFKETKVRVYNDELSKKVQEALFKLGYMWEFTLGANISVRYIFIRDRIMTNSVIECFNAHDFKEVQAHEILEEASKL